MTILSNWPDRLWPDQRHIFLKNCVRFSGIAAMAFGTTHRPMYDANGNYPRRQFETITPSIVMAVEVLPDGAQAARMRINS